MVDDDAKIGIAFDELAQRTQVLGPDQGIEAQPEFR